MAAAEPPPPFAQQPRPPLRPRRALPRPPGLRPPLCAQPERRSEAAPGRRGQPGRVSSLAGAAGDSEPPSPARVLGTGGTAFRARRASQIAGEANLGSRPPSRTAGETATRLLPSTPHPKTRNPRPGRTRSPLPPPTALILRAREAPAPRRWLAKGSGKEGWMGPRGGVVMRGM